MYMISMLLNAWENNILVCMFFNLRLESSVLTDYC